MLPGPEAIILEIERAADAMIAGDRAAADEAVGRIAHEPQQLEKRPSLPGPPSRTCFGVRALLAG
jgi:hypothetical protein